MSIHVYIEKKKSKPISLIRIYNYSDSVLLAYYYLISIVWSTSRAFVQRTSIRFSSSLSPSLRQMFLYILQLLYQYTYLILRVCPCIRKTKKVQLQNTRIHVCTFRCTYTYYMVNVPLFPYLCIKYRFVIYLVIVSVRRLRKYLYLGMKVYALLPILQSKEVNNVLATFLIHYAAHSAIYES